eukprot:3182327-Prymnesium_polylepis.1
MACESAEAPAEKIRLPARWTSADATSSESAAATVAASSSLIRLSDRSRLGTARQSSATAANAVGRSPPTCERSSRPETPSCCAARSSPRSKASPISCPSRSVLDHHGAHRHGALDSGGSS